MKSIKRMMKDDELTYQEAVDKYEEQIDDAHDYYKYKRILEG